MTACLKHPIVGLSLLLLLGSVPHLARATTQIDDTIRYEGNEYAIGECPLLMLLLSGRRQLPHFDEISTANRKGFVAVWEIRDSRLYLVSFEAKRDKKPLRIGTLYPGRKLPVFADWYTGKIHIATGEWIEGSFLNPRYTRVRVFDIEEGRVVRSTEHRNAKLDDRYRGDATNWESVPLPVVSVDWNDSGSQLLVAQRDKILLFDTKSKDVTTLHSVGVRQPYQEHLVEARFAGGNFAVRNEGDAVTLLDAKGKPVWRTGNVAGFALSSTGKQLAVVDSDRSITVYQLERPVPEKHVSWRLKNPGGLSRSQKRHLHVEMIRFCAEDRTLVGCISWRGESRCFVAAVEDGKELTWYPGGAFAASQLSYPYLATITPPFDIIVHDLRNGRAVSRCVADKHPPLYSCWVSWDADRLVTVSGRKIQLIDAKKAKAVNEWTLKSGVSRTPPLSFCEQSNSLAIGTVDGKARLFDCAQFRFSGTLSCE